MNACANPVTSLTKGPLDISIIGSLIGDHVIITITRPIHTVSPFANYHLLIHS